VWLYLPSEISKCLPDTQGSVLDSGWRDQGFVRPEVQGCRCTKNKTSGSVSILGYSECQRCKEPEHGRQENTEENGTGLDNRPERPVSELANACGARHKGGKQPEACGGIRTETHGSIAKFYSPFPPFPGETGRWAEILEACPEIEPAVCGVVDGRTNRVDELRALGNGVVPVVAAFAFITLALRAGIIRQIMTRWGQEIAIKEGWLK